MAGCKSTALAAGVRAAGVPAAWAIAACALRVSLRRPLVMVVTVAALLLMPALAMLTAFELGDGHRMARDAAMAVFGAAGVLLAFTVTAAAAYDRAAPGALALILCKPVSHAALLLGRHAGLAVLMAWFSLTAGTGVLLVDRMAMAARGMALRVAALYGGALAGALLYAAAASYRGRASFAAGVARALPAPLVAAALVAACMHPAGGWCRCGAFFDWDVFRVCLLLALFFQVMTALAACLTAWCRLPLALCGYGGVLMAGALADYLAARAPGGYGAALARLLPAWQDFWMVDVLAGGGVVGWGYIVAAAVYAVLLAAAFLTAALTSSLLAD